MTKAGIFNDTSVSGHYGCTAVMSTLTTGLAERGIVEAYLWPVGIEWQGHVPYLEAHRPDIIIVNGEGTIHHSAERKRTRDLCEVAHFAKARDIPAYLINASISDLTPTALDALRDFNVIYVRETGSQNYLEGHGIEAKVVPDLSLGWPAPGGNTPRSGIIVTDSVFGKTAADLRAFASATDANFESMNPRKSTLQRLGNSVLKRLKSSPAAVKWRARSDVDNFVRRLSRSELVITGRFHSVMLAILTDTPFVALPSNTGKIEAVLRDCFGDTSRMITAGELSAPAFRARVSAGMPFSEDELKAMSHYREAARSDRAAMFNAVAGTRSS